MSFGFSREGCRPQAPGLVNGRGRRGDSSRPCSRGLSGDQPRRTKPGGRVETLCDLHQQRAKWPEGCSADESLSLLKERALWRVAATTCPIFGVWWTNRTRRLRGRCSLPRLDQYRPRAKWQRRYSADEILWLGKNVFSGGRNPVVASGGVTFADTACRMFRSHDHR